MLVCLFYSLAVLYFIVLYVIVDWVKCYAQDRQDLRIFLGQKSGGPEDIRSQPLVLE